MGLYVGYHGTNVLAAEKIISSQKFILSTGEDEWLGIGVYFFWDADDAGWWCADCLKLKTYTVLQADLEASTVVDFVHRRGDLESFKKFCNQVKDKSSKMGNGKKRQNYMGLAIKMMVALQKPDIIIGGFDQNRKIWFNNAELKSKFPLVVSQVQMCVLNRDCIKNISVYKEVV